VTCAGRVTPTYKRMFLATGYEALWHDVAYAWAWKPVLILLGGSLASGLQDSTQAPRC
jgi:hypothetical protein